MGIIARDHSPSAIIYMYIAYKHARSTTRFLPDNYLWWGAQVYPWSSGGGSWVLCRRARCPTRWSSMFLKFYIVSSPVYRGKVCYLFDCATSCVVKCQFCNFQLSAITSHCLQYGNNRMGSAFDDNHAPCYNYSYGMICSLQTVFWHCTFQTCQMTNLFAMDPLSSWNLDYYNSYRISQRNYFIANYHI